MDGFVELDYYLKSLEKENDDNIKEDNTLNDLAKAMENISSLMAELQAKKESNNEEVIETKTDDVVEEQEL